MRPRFASTLVFTLLCGACVAQSYKACKADPASLIDDRDGVIVKTVSFQAPSGRLVANVFLPKTTEPVAGIAFSQASIQYADSRTDLRSFAMAMARAGAASIMLDGTIDWHTPNDDAKRPWTEVACAAQWLMANANLDLDRVAIGGPIQSGGDPFCPLGLGTQPCGQSVFYINFGWTGPNEAHYTDLMKTPQGQLQMTRVPEGFRLKPVQLEWLMGKPFTWGDPHVMARTSIDR